MNLLPRIEGNSLKIFNADTGAIHRTAQLPSNSTYSGPIVSGNLVTVTIHPKNGGSDVVRTFDLNTGSLKKTITL